MNQLRRPNDVCRSRLDYFGERLPLRSEALTIPVLAVPEVHAAGENGVPRPGSTDHAVEIIGASNPGEVSALGTENDFFGSA